MDVCSISRGEGGRGWVVFDALKYVADGFAGQKARPDLQACVSTGMIDFCVEMVAAVASAGVEGLQDTNHAVLLYALVWPQYCSSLADCEATPRGVATALAFCLEHSWTS